ncbi:MAG: CRISPR-associated endonuclease Cas2 [Myxococcota bacterium]
MERATILVCYDICDPKRLKKVFDTCKAFGQHLQYSVFRCDLTAKRRAELVAKLDRLIHHDEDQVLFVTVGRPEGRARKAFETLGKPYRPVVPGPVIV